LRKFFCFKYTRWGSPPDISLYENLKFPVFYHGSYWLYQKIKFLEHFLNFRVTQTSSEKQTSKKPSGIYSALVFSAFKREQIWRFLSYMFIHSSQAHLISNVVFQILLGLPLELVHCWWRVTIVYLSGILAGSLAQSCFKPCTGVCGASGGVYALITAHLATVIMNWQEMKHAAAQLFFFVIFCTSDIYADVFLVSSSDNISGVVHLFGGLAGILVGIGVLRNLRVRPYQRKLWLMSISLYFILILYGIFYNFKFVNIQYSENLSNTKNCTKYFSNSTNNFYTFEKI
jgi:rhomboid-related protein 1/2/3